MEVIHSNGDAKIDTVAYGNNRSAFMDSAVTGTDGAYFIDGIPPGTYAVVPVDAGTDSGAVYAFTASNDSGNVSWQPVN